MRGMTLVRYWFEFDEDEHATTAALGLSGGAGVTGLDEDDCLALLRDAVHAELPPVALRVRDVVVDPRVLGIRIGPSMGDPARRGVWWPSVGTP